MANKMLTITFFEIEDCIDELFNIKTDEFETNKLTTEDNIIIGRYNYEPNTRFGNPNTTDDVLYLDQESNLVGVVTHSDRPKGETIINEIDDSVDGLVYAPKYSQDSSTQFYRTFGFNGYTTSFREDLRNYNHNTDPRYIEPDEIMEERAMHSRRNPSDDWLDEITEELIENGHYVSNMDCILEEDGNSYSFCNPMRLTGIPENELDDELRNLIFKRMKQLINDNVPTVNEVLDE